MKSMMPWCLAAALAGTAHAGTEADAPPATNHDKVVVAGTVPDEATRQAILSRVRELYGADRVVDQLGVGPLVAPPQWSTHVLRMLQPELKQVSHGSLSVEGNVVKLQGDVANESLRQQVASQVSTRIDNPTYTVRNNLRIGSSDQQVVDATLANRIVEFDAGQATLTGGGQSVLDQLVPVLRQLQGRRFEVVGHTDGQGARQANLALSSARAATVKAYLVSKGVPEAAITASGQGPDQPVADNATPEGRSRNRRIAFRVVP